MSGFEQIPEIAERIKRSKMELQDNGNYWAPEWDSQSCCDQDFVNNFKKGWLSQQAIIDNLKAQLNNMEDCYIEKKKINDEQSEIIQGHFAARQELQKRIDCVSQEVKGLERFTHEDCIVDFEVLQGAVSHACKRLEKALQVPMGAKL